MSDHNVHMHIIDVHTYVQIYVTKAFALIFTFFKHISG